MSARVTTATSAMAAFVVGVALRAAIVLVIGHYGAPNLWENGAIAEALLAGDGFSIAITGRLQPTSWQAPGYPGLLAGLWSIFGKNPSAHLLLSLAQAIALSSIVFPLGYLAMRWFGRAAATIVPWLSLAVPLYGWYPTRLHQVAFVMALYPWVLAGWLSLEEREGRLRAACLGMLTGVAALLQPLTLIATAPVALARLWPVSWLRVSRVLVAGVFVLLTLAPWGVRNFEVHGRLVPVKNSFGKEFWMGNNPHATGTSYASGGVLEITSAHPPACFAHRETMSEMQLFDAMLNEGLEYVRADVPGFLRRTSRKIGWFWTSAPLDLVRHSLGGEAVRYRLLYQASWAVLVVLALVGYARGRPRAEALCVAGVFVLAYSAVYGLTHVGQVRYRGEMEFIFMPAAAAGIAYLGAALGRRDGRAPRSDG